MNCDQCGEPCPTFRVTVATREGWLNFCTNEHAKSWTAETGHDEFVYMVPSWELDSLTNFEPLGWA